MNKPTTNKTLSREELKIHLKEWYQSLSVLILTDRQAYKQIRRLIITSRDK